VAALVLVAVAVAAGGYLVLSGGGGRRAPRAPARGIEIALDDDPVFVRQDHYSRELAFEQARRLGVSWIRVVVPWHTVAGGSATRRRPPAGRIYDWTVYDGLVGAARAHGVQVEMALAGPAPAWATADGRVGVDRPEPGSFAGFARSAARHFRGLIHRYSIWNEPNHVAWIAPLQAAPTVYRRLYAAGWAAIKQVDPRAQVLIGETSPHGRPGKVISPLRFLRAVACARCAPLHADGYAHHPYEFADPPERSFPGPDDVTIGSLGRLTSALDRLAAAGLLSTPGGHPLPVYLTEFGYYRSGPHALAPSTRAAYLVRAFGIAARLYPRVRQILQYLLVAPPPGYPGGQFDTSLLTQTGVPTPAFKALAAWASGRSVGPRW